MNLKKRSQEFSQIAKKYGYNIKNVHSQEIISQFSFGLSRHHVLKQEKENNIINFQFLNQEKALENKYVLEILTYDQDNPLYIAVVEDMSSLLYLFFENFEVKDFYESVKHFKVLTKKDLSKLVVSYDKKRTVKEWIKARENYLCSNDDFILFINDDLDQYNFEKNLQISSFDFLKRKTKLRSIPLIKEYYKKLIVSGEYVSINILNALYFLREDFDISPYLNMKNVQNIYHEYLSIETKISISNIKKNQTWICKRTLEEVKVKKIDNYNEGNKIHYVGEGINGYSNDDHFIKSFYLVKN